MSDEAVKKCTIYCNWCKNETNHRLNGAHRADFDNEGGLRETLI